jgi:hypothetical protein
MRARNEEKVHFEAEAVQSAAAPWKDRPFHRIVYYAANRRAVVCERLGMSGTQSSRRLDNL